MPHQYTEAYGNMRVDIQQQFQFDYKPINRFSFDLLEKYGLTAESHIATNLGCESHCEIKDVEISDNKVSFSLHRKPTCIKRIMFNETYMSHQTMHEPACEEEKMDLTIVSHFVYQKPAEEVEAEQKKEEEKKVEKKVEAKKTMAQKAKELEEAKKADEPVDEKKD